MNRLLLLLMSLAEICNFNMSASGQTIDSMSFLNVTTIAKINQGNSYITFPADIGNIEPLWFEGNINPDFYIRRSKNSRLIGVLTPQIIIRMYREESFPVRTPSYIPQITSYYMFPGKKQQFVQSAFFKIAHHSNGQENSFYLENGEPNLLSGDFASNFLEAGLIKTRFIQRYNAHSFYKSSVEVHPLQWQADELQGNYSPVRWHNTFSIFRLPVNSAQNESKKAAISMKSEATWMFGKTGDWENLSSERLTLSFTFNYHPAFFEDIGFFAQLYHGMDYYNMYFNHQLNIIRFGIMTDKLRF